MTEGVLPPLGSRQDYLDYLDGYAVDTVDDLLERRLPHGLVKSYMLETVRDGVDSPSLPALLEALGIHVTQVDEGFLTLRDDRFGGIAAALELIEQRYPVLYTLLPSDQAKQWAFGLVDRSPWLDHLWLSTPLLAELWNVVQRTSPPYKFTRLTFEHDAFYEVQTSAAADETPLDAGDADDESSAGADVDDEAQPLRGVDRRSSRFTMVDRIDVVRSALPNLQQTYRPLHSITQLRMPAAGRGGHDFFYDGRATNRSDSFADHRAWVRFVVETYSRATKATEDTLWVAAEAAEAVGPGIDLRGAPVFLRFSQPLDAATFDRWVSLTFGRRRNRFRLTGRVLRLGPSKVHVYGVDRHLWQPIVLELTHQHIAGFLPEGTCGNTVHRLVTNIQRYLDPDVQAWIGSESYGSLLHRAIARSDAG